ncbi:MAG: hypothetical protein KJ046_14035 [Anaerolineae bacterium]|nr:hypothetical protein [Anaerolineae bacterium]
MMRIAFGLMLLLAIVGVSCTSTPASETRSNGEGDVLAITLITPEGHTNPGPAAQSAYPIEEIMPTEYPEITVVAPSGEIDLAQLTPLPPGTAEREMPEPGRPGASESVELGRLIRAIATDLSAITGLTPDEIAFVSATPVVWPDGGLGCPPAGTSYVELQVEGLLVKMAANNQTYTYHTEGMSRFVNCRDGQPVSSGSVPVP